MPISKYVVCTGGKLLCQKKKKNSAAAAKAVNNWKLVSFEPSNDVTSLNAGFPNANIFQNGDF